MSASISNQLPDTLEFETPKHAFFVKSWGQLLQAMIYAISKKERTAIVLLITPEFLAGSSCRFKDSEYIRFVPVDPKRALIPIQAFITQQFLTREEISVAIWLQDYDVQLHTFSPANDIALYKRDDIIVHDAGDYSRMRIDKQLPDSDNQAVYRIYLKELPLDYNPATDKKVRTWDYMQALRNLSAEEADIILDTFNVRTIATGDKDVLFLHSEPEAEKFTQAQIDHIHYLVSVLCEHLIAEGYTVWFKGHPKRFWLPKGVEGLRYIPHFLPAELLTLNVDGNFEYIASVRSSAVDTLCTETGCKAVNGISVNAKKAYKLGNLRHIRTQGYHAYKKGLLRVARALLTNQDILRLWETWCR